MRRTLLLAVTVVAVLAAGAPAGAQDPVGVHGVAGPQAKFYGYLTPVMVAQVGSEPIFANLDLDVHNIEQDFVTDGFGGPSTQPWCMNYEGGCPLFWSRNIRIAQTTPIVGLENATPMTVYSFLCFLHPSMRGTLIVV